MKNSRLASWKTALPFLLPSLAGFVVFSIIPMIMQIFVSLTSWDGLSELTLFSDFSGFMDRFYVGIENYKEILTSKEFYQVIGNTLEFVILYIPLMLIASMIVALILNSHVKGVEFSAFFTISRLSPLGRWAQSGQCPQSFLPRSGRIWGTLALC